jgi:hypothetical protein
MPFLTDNAWPSGLLTCFEHSRQRREVFENRYYGPYDKLLNYCFGSDFTFYVAPQNPPTDNTSDDNPCDDLGFILVLIVFNNNNQPVLVVEVKDDYYARKPQYRYDADKLMRGRYDFIVDDCPTPRLWGLSLLGTSMRVYCANKTTNRITPPYIPRDSDRVLASSFLAGEWDVDILSESGFAKMKEIVTDIFTHTANM